MFKAIFITKENKEKMRLKAKRQTLKGIKNLEKSYYMNDSLGLPNILISKEYLERRFGSIEIAAECLSEKIEASPITPEEVKELYNVDYKVKKVCVADIKYTFHGKYIDHLGVSFTKAERMQMIINKEKENPDYYTKNLKNPEFVKNDKDPIKIIFKEDETGHNYGTIYEGNNRILKLKCDMASELAKTKDPREIIKIHEKYSFYVQCKDVKDIKLSKGASK